MGQETNIRREIYTMRNLDAALSNAAPKVTRIAAVEILHAAADRALQTADVQDDNVYSIFMFSKHQEASGGFCK